MKNSTRRNIRRWTTLLGITLLVALAVSGLTGSGIQVLGTAAQPVADV